MNSFTIQRFEFELVDIVNQLIDVPPRAKWAEMRVADAGEMLIIDFCIESEFADRQNDEKTEDEKPSEKPADARGEDRMTEEASAPPESRPAPALERTVGPNENRAIAALSKKSFWTYLEVDDATAAREKLLNETRSRDLAEYDRDRHKRALFLDVMGGFEAWLNT